MNVAYFGLTCKTFGVEQLNIKCKLGQLFLKVD